MSNETESQVAQPREVTHGLGSSPPRRARDEDTVEGAVRLAYGTEAVGLAERYPDLAEGDFALHANNVRVMLKEHFDDKRAEAIASGEYTRDGIRKLEREWAEESLDSLSPYWRLVSEHEELVAGHDEFFEKEGTLDPTEATPAILSELRGLDALTRSVVYGQAIEEGDEGVIAALESAGKVFNKETSRLEDFVDPDRIRANRIARGKARHPDKAETQGRSRRLASAYRGVLVSSKAAIFRKVPGLAEVHGDEGIEFP